MKKLDQSISQDYFPIKLYLNDLVEIQQILRECSKDHKFESSGYSFDSIEELVANIGKRELFELEINSSGPYSRIEFTRMWAKLYVGSSTLDSAGLFHNLSQVLAKARRQPWFMYSYYSIWGLNIFSLAATFIRSPFTSAFSYCALAIVFWVLFVRLRRNSTIILVSRDVPMSFWSRNKDEIIIALISAVMGAILGILGTVLVRNWLGLQ